MSVYWNNSGGRGESGAGAALKMVMGESGTWGQAEGGAISDEGGRVLAVRSAARVVAGCISF